MELFAKCLIRSASSVGVTCIWLCVQISGFLFLSKIIWGIFHQMGQNSKVILSIFLVHFNQKDTDIFSNWSHALRSIKGYEFKYIFSVLLHMFPEKILSHFYLPSLFRPFSSKYFLG